MLNHITIMGRLTRDPELRYTQSQTPVASFTLAVDRDFGNRDGGEKQTDFIDCVAWRSTAEFVSKYFAKGSMAVVSGRLQIRDWTDREGGKRRSAEVVVDNMYFGESRRRDGGEKQTDFIDCVAWRQTAEFVSKYFTKGRMAVVSGRLQIRDWTDREGGKRRSAEVVVDNVYFGDSRRDNNDSGNYGGNSYGSSYGDSSRSYSAPASSAPSANTFAELDDGDGELPF